jgi:hypothetical protein
VDGGGTYVIIMAHFKVKKDNFTCGIGITKHETSKHPIKKSTQKKNQIIQ